MEVAYRKLMRRCICLAVLFSLSVVSFSSARFIPRNRTELIQKLNRKRITRQIAPINSFYGTKRQVRAGRGGTIREGARLYVPADVSGVALARALARVTEYFGDWAHRIESDDQGRSMMALGDSFKVSHAAFPNERLPRFDVKVSVSHWEPTHRVSLHEEFPATQKRRNHTQNYEIVNHPDGGHVLLYHGELDTLRPSDLRAPSWFLAAVFTIDRHTREIPSLRKIKRLARQEQKRINENVATNR